MNATWAGALNRATNLRGCPYEAEVATEKLNGAVSKAEEGRSLALRSEPALSNANLGGTVVQRMTNVVEARRNVGQAK